MLSRQLCLLRSPPFPLCLSICFELPAQCDEDLRLIEFKRAQLRLDGVQVLVLGRYDCFVFSDDLHQIAGSCCAQLEVRSFVFFLGAQFGYINLCKTNVLKVDRST